MVNETKRIGTEDLIELLEAVAYVGSDAAEEKFERRYRALLRRAKDGDEVAKEYLAYEYGVGEII